MPDAPAHIEFSALDGENGDPGISVTVEPGATMLLTQDLRVRLLRVRSGGTVVMNGYEVHGRMDAEG